MALLAASASIMAAVSALVLPGDFSTEVWIPRSRHSRTMGSSCPGRVTT